MRSRHIVLAVLAIPIIGTVMFQASGTWLKPDRSPQRAVTEEVNPPPPAELAESALDQLICPSPSPF